jgi:RNA polymerase sigma-70 factor, ECF subfamily
MSYSNMSHSELVQACLTGDEDAWTEFKARFDKVISLAVLRTALRYKHTSKQFLEDGVGDVYLKLWNNNCAILRNFEFRTEGGIFGFLKVIATNVVHDHFRPHPSEREIGFEDVYGPECDDPPIAVLDGPECIERSVLIKEIEDILLKITGPDGERDRTIFWLHHRQGFTAQEIAAFYAGQLTVKGVESVIHRLTKEIRKRLSDKDSDNDGE